MKKHTLLQRLLPLAMLAAMLLSAVPAAAAFHDTAGHWAEKTLSEWQDKGLIDGYGDGSFQPNGTVTRAEFAKLVNRTLGFTAESEISFSDVTERDWFHAEVARAVAAGYAHGSGGLFRPNRPVTRAEAAAMLARAAGLAANEERADAFADAASIPAWARGSVGAVAEAGYMNGYPDGAFGASGPMTRAEAVVTLDRVRRSAQKTVIEKAGTTLENETVAGDLVIAESVGEGNVTLKNVTVLGSVIVKGGGANSIYFDNVRVGGTVRLEKEGVHLRLRGDTALERVEIGLPCRITRDSTFKGTLGALVIDLEKTSNQKIQIEVPAKRVELLSRANVALNADVETLRIDRDAEGAQLDIKRGVTVGELSIDARVALTGSGLVVSLVVSVSGVTVSGSLTVEKTGTEGGAKAPTTSGGSSSGGSSGGSYVSVKIVTGAAAVPDVAVDYGTSEADAMGRLPGTVTLNVTENGTAGTVEAAVRWALDRAYSKDPSMDTVYTATGTVTIPDGYTYDGTLTVTASLTVTANPENVVVGILEVAGLELPYGAQESDVQLPAQVTVKNKNGHTERADVTWTLEGEWASPGVNTFMGTVDMPIDQYYNGERTADITTTVTVVESGVTPKTKAVVDHVPLRLTSIDYASTGELVLAAARQGLPTNVLLKCEDGSYIEVAVRPDDWEFTQTPYVPTSGKNQTVSFTENAALPEGYAYAGGTSPVRCHLEVKALDTAALDSALAAAKTQLDTLTDSEDAALADSEKIFVAANGVTADSVTKGVKFIERSQTATLKDAYAAARSKTVSDFASQAECDQTAQELQEASDAFTAIVPNVGTLYTNAMILEAVKNGGAVNPQYSSEFAYSAEMQPLRKDYTYWLYGSSWTVPGSNVTVSIDWSVSGDGAQYLAFAPEGGRDHKNNMHSYGVTVTEQPDEPKEVRFIATVKDYDGTVIGKLGTNGEYTATIGAPIQVDTNADVAAPKMTSTIANNISLRVPLTGSEYITGVDTSEITIKGNEDPTTAPLSINKAFLTAGEICTVNRYGLFVPVTASCGTMALKPVQTNSDGTPKLNYSTGKIRITIKPEALTVNEASGWYAPDGDLTYDAVVWGCYPMITITPHNAGEGEQTVSVRIEYAYKRFIGAVAFAETNSNQGAVDTALKVYFNADNYQQDDSGQDLITCTKAVESLENGTTYYIWYNFDSDGNFGNSSCWENTNETFQISSDGETP